MVDVQPTLFCGVPRIFTRIHQVVMNGVAEKGCLARNVFFHAFNKQGDLLRANQPLDAGWDTKVFKPLRTRMGLGSARVIVTGAAPMAPYLAEFLKIVSGVPVLEGYGQLAVQRAASFLFFAPSVLLLQSLPIQFFRSVFTNVAVFVLFSVCRYDRGLRRHFHRPHRRRQPRSDWPSRLLGRGAPGGHSGHELLGQLRNIFVARVSRA